MAEECTHDCSTCTANCSSRDKGQIEKEPLNPQSTVRHVIGIVSGKGGVGKSIVTSMMSVLMRRRDYGVAVLDADITGPSIPKAFGTTGDVYSDGNGLIPLKTKTGIQMMSVNLLLEDETRPVVWRGPVIAGTGDVPLTVFQSLPLDGIIILTTPQELVSMIVKKALNMAQLMNIPVIGLVENMSYVKCPDCGKEMHIFGESKAETLCETYGIPFLGRVPLDPNLAALCDKGSIELMEVDYLDKAADAVADFCK